MPLNPRDASAAAQRPARCRPRRPAALTSPRTTTTTTTTTTTDRPAAQYVSAEDEPDLTVAQVERRFFSTAELQDAREGFAISTRLGVVGLSHFDDAPLGRGTEWEGTSGPVSLALNELLVVQRAYKQGSAEHTEVPYGYLTGMKSQLH
jgi:hypothetical protein